MVSLESVEQAIREVAQANGATLALLFGSYARGTQTQHSDVDVIFVEPTSDRFMARLARYFDPLSERLPVAVEVLVYTPEEFQRMKQGPFVGRAVAEGIKVYEHREP